MESFNQSLFLLLNAPAHPNAWVVLLAQFMAMLPQWLIPLLLVIGWLKGDSDRRKGLLAATITAGVALSLNQVIGLFWQHPRPFMIGLGNTLIPHVADSSFPSDHMTLICAVAFSLLWYPALRQTGRLLLCLSLPVAWARIYLGVHFPFDMLGAMVITLLCAFAINKNPAWLIEPCFRPAIRLYAYLFSPAIQRGWLK